MYLLRSQLGYVHLKALRKSHELVQADIAEVTYAIVNYLKNEGLTA